MNYNSLTVPILREHCKSRNIQACQGSRYIKKQKLIEILKNDDLNSSINRLNIQPTPIPESNERLSEYISVDEFKRQITNNNNDYIYLYFNNTNPRTIQELQEKKNKLLLWASENGHVEVIKVLLENNANIEATDNSERTSLILATLYGHIKTVKLLLDAGANIEAAGRNRQTSLITAASNNGRIRILKILLAAGADTEAEDYQENTSLLVASGFGRVQIVKILLAAGADVEAADINGEKSLSSALRYISGRRNVIKVLEDYIDDFITNYVIDPQYLITDNIQDCLNDLDLIGTSFEELYQLYPSQILINEENYCFSAQELQQLLENSKLNPYTRVRFKPDFLRAARKLISDNINTTYILEDDTTLNINPDQEAKQQILFNMQPFEAYSYFPIDKFLHLKKVRVLELVTWLNGIQDILIIDYLQIQQLRLAHNDIQTVKLLSEYLKDIVYNRLLDVRTIGSLISTKLEDF